MVNVRKWYCITQIVTDILLIVKYLQQLSVLNFENVSVSVTYGGVKLLQTFIYTWYGTYLTNAVSFYNLYY